MTSDFGRIKLPKGKTVNENAKERADFTSGGSLYSSFKDWQYEVANGNTILGLRDWRNWRKHKLESEAQ